MDMPKRKHPRLKKYDYSQNGCYFITVCVKNKAKVLSFVGRDAHIPPEDAHIPPEDAHIPPEDAHIPPEDTRSLIKLSDIGVVVDRYIKNIDLVYGNICVDKYVIMPNHLHLLISITSGNSTDGGMRACRPTINTIVRSLKTMVTKTIGYSIWQESFYDEVITSEEHYYGVWEYIDSNPLKWNEDKYYCT